MSRDEPKSIFYILKEIISFLKDTDLDIEEEKMVRKDLIENVKDLMIHDNLNSEQKKIAQIILTKLYTWTPFHKEFKGLGHLPELIDQLFMASDLAVPKESAARVKVKYFKDDGKEVIEQNLAKEVDLEDILAQIPKFPTLESYNNNHIGFINDKGDSLQFTRLEEQVWLLDLMVANSDETDISLNDDSLTTEAVLEIITSFFTEIDGTKEIRNKLQITDHIKSILSQEIKNGKFLSPSELASALNLEVEEAEEYLNLITSNIDYEGREIPSLKLRARNAFKKFVDPNLYEMINNLGMDFYTAKKVGKYLIDIGWIERFPRIPVK